MRLQGGSRFIVWLETVFLIPGHSKDGVVWRIGGNLCCGAGGVCCGIGAGSLVCWKCCSDLIVLPMSPTEDDTEPKLYVAGAPYEVLEFEVSVAWPLSETSQDPSLGRSLCFSEAWLLKIGCVARCAFLVCDLVVFVDRARLGGGAAVERWWFSLLVAM